MYHISEDKRAKRSALLVCQGLDKCLETNAFSDITVSDISRACTVSRSTFYRLFDNLTDVLAYQCSLLFQETLDSLASVDNVPTTKDYVLAFMRACLAHPPFINALAHSGRIDLLYQAHLDYAQIIKDSLFPNRKISDTQMNYLLSILTSSIFSVFVIWQGEQDERSPERLYRYCKDSVALLNDLLQEKP